MSSSDKKTGSAPAPVVSRSRLRILVWGIPGLLLAAFLFWRAHEGEEQVTAASTGYNATARGLLGWDERWVEQADVPPFKTVGSGHRIHYPALLAEAVLCSAAGLLVARIVAAFLTPRPHRPWE